MDFEMTVRMFILLVFISDAKAVGEPYIFIRIWLYITTTE